MSTVHERDDKQEFAQAKRLVKAAIRQLRQRPDPRLRAERTQVARQIIETSGWMHKALSRLIGMPPCTSKEQLTLSPFFRNNLVHHQRRLHRPTT